MTEFHAVNHIADNGLARSKSSALVRPLDGAGGAYRGRLHQPRIHLFKVLKKLWAFATNMPQYGRLIARAYVD
jgi:hypothetical protein